jgi:ATP-binding cassette subfamily B protein
MAKKSKDLEGRVKHGLFSNIVYLYKLLFESDKRIKWYLVISIIMVIAVPMILVLLPSYAVKLLEEKVTLIEYILSIGMLIIIYIFSSILRDVTRQMYDISCSAFRSFRCIKKLINYNINCDYDFIESYNKQKYIERATESIGSNWVGVELLYKNFPQVIINFVGLIIFSAAITSIDIRILIILILMAIFNLYLNSYARKFLDSTMDENNKLIKNDWYIKDRVKDIDTGKDVRIFSMQKWFLKLINSNIEKSKNWQKRIEKRFYIPVVSDTIWAGVRDFAAYYILVKMVMNGEISIATFVLFLGIIRTFSDWFFGLVGGFNDLIKANNQVDDYRTVLEIENKYKRSGGVELKIDKENPPEIIFDKVSFCYEGATKDTIKDLSLYIKAGEKLAIVGNNGAGKSTIIKLLSGLYMPTKGDIYINGINIKDMNIEKYYKELSVVFQEIDPIEFTILNNVTGRIKEESDTDKFYDAVKKAGIYDKIMSLKKREDTFISPIFDEEGIKLSGGETQKLLLARALYKDSPILILDEPTSVLDPIAESKMYEKYEEFSKNKTSIFISHRLASTRFCNRIIFLEDGEIREEGTHEELIMSDKSYAELFRVQSHYYREEEGVIYE